MKLQEAYKLQKLQEKLHRIDEEYVLLEAVDRELIKEIAKLVKQLKSINFGGISSLNVARDAALRDMSDVLAGTSKKGLIRKVINFFRSQNENPIIDVVTFADAIKNFCDAMLQLIDAHKTNETLSPDISVQRLIAGSAGEKSRGGQNIRKFIINELKPSSILSRFTKNWITKYLKGNLNKLANEISEISVIEFEQIAQNVVNALKGTQAVVNVIASQETDVNKEVEKMTRGSSISDIGKEEKPTEKTLRRQEKSDENKHKMMVSSVQEFLKQNEIGEIPDAEIDLIIKVLQSKGYVK